MKRSLDILIVILILLPVLAISSLISLIILIQCGSPVIYWSERVGLEGKIFKMPKFRTMELDTPNIATHLIEDPQKYITRFGSILRKSSLDEIPQIWCIIKGDMSFVGPRPALINQDELISARREKIQMLTPGLTGWAQVNGRDTLTIQEKVAFDTEYFEKKLIIFDLKILLITLQKVIFKQDISH